MQALLFPIGAEWYALRLNDVREVIPAPPITKVPGAPVWVVGVANLRGELLPVVDTAVRLELDRIDDPVFLAVVDTERGPAGLGATGQPEPVDLGEPTGGGEGRAAVARFDVGDRVATLLDVAELMRVA